MDNLRFIDSVLGCVISGAKEELEAKGCTFRSQTDTETVAHLVASIYGQVKDLTKAVHLASEKNSKVLMLYVLCIIMNQIKSL